VSIPDGVDGKAVIRYLLEHFNLEIAGGMGQLAGKIWRIGLMGYNSRAENVLLLLNALREALSNC
jgi:alanine-glyoxylate transaminase/serine-glyoxylate transaminase/serine-pyruvate transaminase